jgi:cytochrome P450
VVQPVLTKQHVAQFAGHMVDAAKQFPVDSSQAAEVDLDAECRAITLRALGRSVLGIDLDERSNDLAEPLRTALQYLTDRSLRPVRAPRSWPTPARYRARTASKETHQLAGEIVQICRADPSHDAPLVQALLAATDPTTGKALSDTELQDELVAFMFAGQDTTSTALAYSLWELGNHGDMQDRVAEEAGAIGDRPLIAADVPHLTYTAQVVHEALRLCPPAPVVARCAMTDIEIDGYRVEAGTMMVVGIYAIHRDPALWDDPLRFDPERFNNQNSKGRDRWQFLPFGGGPRSCVGDHFAMLEAVLALATIVRSTRIRSIDSDFPLALPFTMVAGAPIRAEVLPRTLS